MCDRGGSRGSGRLGVLWRCAGGRLGVLGCGAGWTGPLAGRSEIAVLSHRLAGLAVVQWLLGAARGVPMGRGALAVARPWTSPGIYFDQMKK